MPSSAHQLARMCVCVRARGRAHVCVVTGYMLNGVSSNRAGEVLPVFALTSTSHHNTITNRFHILQVCDVTVAHNLNRASKVVSCFTVQWAMKK